VLCRPILLPENAARFEYDGAEYSVDAIIPTMTCRRQFKIVCLSDFTLEHTIALTDDCHKNYLGMICSGMGYWKGFQKCMHKACRVEEMGHAIDIALGSSHNRACPLGYEIQLKGGCSPTCHADCLMSSNQTCRQVFYSYTCTEARTKLRPHSHLQKQITETTSRWHATLSTWGLIKHIELPAKLLNYF